MCFQQKVDAHAALWIKKHQYDDFVILMKTRLFHQKILF